MISQLLVIFVFALTFVVLPFGSSWYETPKVLVALIGVLTLTLIFLKQNFSEKWTRSIPNQFWLTFGGLLVFSLLHLWFNDTTTAFLGNVFRWQGTLFLWGLLAVVCLSYFSPKYKNFSWGALAVLLLTFVGAIFLPKDLAGRAVGSLGEANSLGASVLFLWPLAAMGRKKSVGLVSFLLAGGTIFLSGSRSALVGLFVSGVFIVLSHLWRARQALVVSLSGLVASLSLPFLGVQQTFDSRPTIWRTALQAGWQKPVWGWGFGNVEHGLLAAAHEISTALRFQYVDSSHNIFLDWWVQGGVLGVIFLGLLILPAIQGLQQQKQYFPLASFLGVGAVTLFNPVSVAVLVPFFWLIGQGWKHSQLKF